MSIPIGPSHRWSPRTCAWLVALLVWAWPAAAELASRDFTPRELAALAAGKLVRRPLRNAGTAPGLVGGSSWQLIDAPLDVVWSALHDVERYPKMLPGVIEARLVLREDDRRIVYLTQGRWPIYTSHYLIVHSVPARHGIHFRVDPDRPHGVRDGFGLIRVVARNERQTLLAFGIRAELGHGILASVTASFVQARMLELPSTLKHFLESGGKNRYLEPRRVSAAHRRRRSTSPTRRSLSTLVRRPRAARSPARSTQVRGQASRSHKARPISCARRNRDTGAPIDGVRVVARDRAGVFNGTVFEILLPRRRDWAKGAGRG